MAFANLRTRLTSLTTAVALCGVTVAIVSPTSTTMVSAATSGIVTADLVLNLDPNMSSSYPGSGTTVTDVSGGGRDGTLAGSPLPTFDSVSPKSFQFTRTFVGNTASGASKITVNSRPLTDNFTIQAWIKTDQVGHATAHYTTMYIMASECGGGANDWGLGVNNTGKLAFGAGPNDATFATPEAVNTNTWTNVAVTRDKATGQIKLYVDGVLEATGNGNAGNSLTCSADGKTWIGNGQDAPAYSFGGNISTVLAYTSVLSAADILTNYNATVDTFHPVTYTITYDANGATSGSVPAADSYTSGGSPTPVSANSGSLVRTDHTFAGWNTAADGTGTSYAAGSSTYSSRANVVLYAVWTPVPTSTTTTTSTTSTVPSSASTTVSAPVLQIEINNPATTTSVGVSASQSTVLRGSGSIPLAQSPPTRATDAPVRSVGSATTTSTSTTSTVPSSASTTVSAPVVPVVETGQAAVTKDGKSQVVTVGRRDNTLVVSVGELSAEVASVDPNGRTLALDANGNVTLAPGSRIAVKVDGFEPGTEMEVWMFSTPVLIGAETVGQSGTLDTVLQIPEDVPTGAHRIAITTKSKGKDAVTFTLGVAVQEFSRESNIATWLIVLPIVLAAGVALFLPSALRRRRRDTAT